MAPLDYSQLRLARNEARLVSLSGSDSAAETGPEWNLEVVSLTDRKTPEYIAVSYRWGAPLLDGPLSAMTEKPTVPIRINGRFLKICENLASFMGQIVSDRSLRGSKFWIDAVCINQEDDEERSYQVSNMMARIYSSAECVIAWLGDSDGYTEQAFDHLSALAEAEAEPLPLFEAAGDVNLTAWEATARLFDRTYWNRSWIIQEIVLPEKVIVRCGGHSVDLGVLSQASHAISTGAWKAYFSGRHPSQRSSRRNYGIPTLCRAIRDSLSTAGHWTDVLLHTLIRSRDFEATNLEDKVYALLGLLPGSVDVAAMPLLRPEFGDCRSAGRTYLNATVQLLRDSDDLLVLSCVEGRQFQTIEIETTITTTTTSSSSSRRLPSWVPDWSCRLPLGLRVTGYKRFAADACFYPVDRQLSREEKQLAWPVLIDERSRTISVKGVFIDDITSCTGTKDEIRQADNGALQRLLKTLLELPATYQVTGEGRLEAFGRSLVGNTARSRELIARTSPVGPGFVGWLSERIDHVFKREDDCEGSWRHLVERFRTQDEEWNRLLSRSKQDPSATSAYRSMLSFGDHLKPFVTRSGYVGLGSECLEEGDAVFILPRSRVPLLFRRSKKRKTTHGQDGDDYHCELVGGAYLHGFMDGQVLRARSDLETNLRSVTVH